MREERAGGGGLSDEGGGLFDVWEKVRLVAPSGPFQPLCSFVSPLKTNVSYKTADTTFLLVSMQMTLKCMVIAVFVVAFVLLLFLIFLLSFFVVAVVDIFVVVICCCCCC